MKPFLRFLLVVLLLSGLFPPKQAALGAPWQEKVDNWIFKNAAGGEVEFLVALSEQADLSAAATLPTRQEKGAYVFAQLTQTAERSQGPVLRDLEQMGVAYRPYWIANLVWVRGALADVQALASRAEVAYIYGNPALQAQLGQPEPASIGAHPASVDGIEANLSKVGADQLWQAGYFGQGVVIGGQDTGYDWDHPGLIQQYRGWDGAQADHNYNWHDAIHSEDSHSLGANPCGLDAQSPCDDYVHGTHTMGIMVGDDGAGNQVGMAPGAQWIGCRNMESGWGKPSTYLECYQWFLAPTDLANENPDPARAPDIINNSWGCTTAEGCTQATPDILRTAVQNITAAGILTVHSAGNDGPGCGSIFNPAGMYPESLTVANTDIDDQLNSSSSRGPTPSGLRKPDVAAPGTGIRSTMPGGGYAGMGGTSMSAPHVAGLAALLISARPELAGQVDALRWFIERKANPNVIVSETCGGISSTQIPNNSFGWGRIDAVQSLKAALAEPEVTASAGAVLPGEPITYTLALDKVYAALPAAGTRLSATLPAGSQFITATLPHTLNAGEITWRLDDFSAGAAQPLALVVRAPASFYTVLPALDTRLIIAELPPLPTQGPSIEIRGLDLKISAPAQVRAGDALTYTLTVTNLATTLSAFDLTIEDTLPQKTNLITATLPFTQTGQVIAWSRAELAPAERWSVQLVVRVPVTATVDLENRYYFLRGIDFELPRGLPVTSALIPAPRLFLPLVKR